MVEHVAIPDNGIHEPKGAATALQGQVYRANGFGSGAWEDIPAPQNEVLVTQESDFGTSVGGVITLQPRTYYRLGNDVVMASRLVASGPFVIGGSSSRTALLTYTGTGDFITTTHSMELEQLSLNLPNQPATSYVINASPGTGNPVVIVTGVIVSMCGGVIRHSGGTIYMFSGSYTHIGNLIRTTGTINSLTMERVVSTGTLVSSIGLNLDNATITTMVVDTDTFSGPGTGISGLAGGANIADGGQGFVNASVFNATTPLFNILPDDGKYQFKGNRGVNDSRNSAQGSIVANATPTVFGAINTPTKALFGAAFVPDTAFRFTVDNTGRFTYTGERTRAFYASAELFASVSGGAARDYYFSIAKNGTVIASSRCKRRFDGSNPGALSVSSVVELAENDYLELYCTALTATTSVVLETASMKVFGV